MVRGRAHILLLAASLTAVIPAMVHAQAARQSLQPLKPAAAERFSPPNCGVRLLEDIFMRVRSAPQIAMAKNLYKQQMDVQAAQPEGPTDYRLAIRPKKASGKSASMPSPSLNLVMAQAPAAPPEPAPVPVPEQWRGNQQYPPVASDFRSRAGVWEARKERDAAGTIAVTFGGAGGAAPGKAIAVSPDGSTPIFDLKTAAGRMLSLADKMDEVQQQAATEQVAARSVRAKAEAAEASLRTDSPESESKDADRLVASKLKAAAPAEKRALARAGTTIAMADLALLPPNVVTGIPLVRLGTSETQANSALQQIGKMKQQKVNKWTVWSWSRPSTQTNSSLQLYMRNGLLDAMRIFDQSLIGPDFGVTLGDPLARVKEKFGEPAFILQEPGPGAGQNYIYPISQVGFQLARPAAGGQPRVVSLLIFNVK